MMSEVRRMNVDHGQLNAARERESSWLHCYWMIPESVDVPWSNQWSEMAIVLEETR